MRNMQHVASHVVRGTMHAESSICPGVHVAAAGMGAVSGDGHFDTESREYRLYTRCAVPAGAQVFLCYGVHTNLQLLGKLHLPFFSI